MFASVKQIFSPKNKDLQKKILFTLLGLFIFKLGTLIVVPGIDKDSLTGQLGFLELLNVMGGGAMERFSIFALGVGPYITASIISELNEQGGVGRAKLNQITRVVGIILAFIQGYMYSFAYIGNGTAMDYMQFSIILTAGTCFLLWLGDQITAKGVGNGISLIIMAGIIASMPNMFASAWGGFVDASSVQGTLLGIVLFIIYVLIYLIIVIGIVFVENAERRIPVQYANKSNATFGGKQNYLPFRLNSAGVIPVIFASALLAIPSIIAQFIKKDGFTLFINKWIVTSSPTGLILYIVLIFAFSYFYTFIQIKPKDMADNLNKNGGYIPGIRPGEETNKYITKVLKKLTVVGAIGLTFIAALPIVFGMVTNLPTSVTIGGTGLLIVVGVALETYKQIESQLVSRNYTRGRRR